MYKCWNCGTEHDGNDMQSYIRGKDAAIERIRKRLIDEMCPSPSDDPCNICGGIELSLMIIDDEFGLHNEPST